MKIALLGYGKMGKSIEKIALERKHTIVYKVNENPDFNQVKQADIVIEFSIPEAAYFNIKNCAKRNIPIVSGTTGWLDNYKAIQDLVEEKQAKFLYASNFSIGVNLFFKLNDMFAKIMSTHPEYKVDITEIHHLEKKDAPSGTAISLAEQIIAQSDYMDWSYPPKDEDNNISIMAKREKGVHGTHIINYTSEIDDIQLKHEAHSRKGFALGAVLAAEWLERSKDFGCFSMKDVLNI